MSPQDVLCQSSDDGEVLRAVVLAGAGIVLVEDDIEGPMKLVLDGPMGTNDFGEFPRREHTRQGHIAHGDRCLAGGSDALGLDAADRLEAGETRRVRYPADRQDRCSPPLAASMRPFLRLEEGKIVCGGEPILRR